MRGQKHGIALLRQAAHAGKHAQLIAKVQAAGGLVHHQYPRLLAQRARHQHQLLLAAAQMRKIALRHILHAHARHGLPRLPYMLGARRGKGRQPMRHAHQHCILHRIAKGWAVRLGNIGNHACHFALRNAARLAAIQQNLALIIAQNT